ncbi:hypothetical protein ACFX13_028827 [Malus domestica]
MPQRSVVQRFRVKKLGLESPAQGDGHDFARRFQGFAGPSFGYPQGALELHRDEKKESYTMVVMVLTIVWVWKTKGSFMKAWEMLMAHALNTHKVDLAVSKLGAAILESKNEELHPSLDTIIAFLKYFEDKKDVDCAENFCEILKCLGCLSCNEYYLLLKTYVAAGKSDLEMRQAKVDELEAQNNKIAMKNKILQEQYEKVFEMLHEPRYTKTHEFITPVEVNYQLGASQHGGPFAIDMGIHVEERATY